MKREVSDLARTITTISSSSNNNSDNSFSSRKEIHKVWANSKHTCIISIPKKIFDKHGVRPGSHIVITDTPVGILVRKSRLTIIKEEPLATTNQVF